MNNQKNSNSALPLIIIGVVLLAALVGGYLLMNRPKTAPAQPGNRASANRASTPPPVTTNVVGAQPPNLLGSPTASVTVEEFADFQCAACAGAHPLAKEIISTYGSRIKFIFRHFPLSIPGHDKSYEAAVATEAAGLQGSNKFWEMQNLLFTNQQVWSTNPEYRKIWEGYASTIGLDVERFKNDMAGMNAKARVDADMGRGRALNVNSTPSIYVNGILVPYQQLTSEGLRQVIDAELQKAPPASQPVAAPSTPANSKTAEASNSKPANTANGNARK